MVQLKLESFSTTQNFSFKIDEGYISHSLIKKNSVQNRLFQTSISQHILGKNALVVLPTGLGKTIIALLVTVETLQRNKGKVLFVAPTRPLVQQHYDTFDLLMAEGPNKCMLSGSVPSKKRNQYYYDSDVIFSTPQCISNDIENDLLPLKELGLLIVDEAHRTIGDYAYVKICESVTCPILGLTASPGGKKKKIMEVLDHLKVETIEARTRNDPDVKIYVKGIDIEWVRVKLSPEMEDIRSILDEYLIEKINKLQKVGILSYKNAGNVSKTDILGSRELITKRFRRNKGVMMGVIHNQSLAVYAFHCLETLETQGVDQLREYLDRFGTDKPSKSKKAFIKDKRIVDVLELSKVHTGISHPKLKALGDVIASQISAKPRSRIIVFTQLRDTIPTIMNIIQETGASGIRFVGQASRPDGKGLKQNKQKQILDDFRDNRFNVLVATSVAEEGLDIPDVDLVIFYEPLPSEIRNIQRKGRTGRHSFGKVKILIAKKSRDEAYLWAGITREKKMRGFIKWMEAEGIKMNKRKNRKKVSG
jgi:Fanconi anemia group M protein